MRTTTAARLRGTGALGALAAAVLLATTACQPEDEAQGAASPSSTASAGTEASPSAGASDAPSPTASATAKDPACKGWKGIDLMLLPGVRAEGERARLKVQEGTWSCPSTDMPVWHAIGPKHEIRLSGTAKISVNQPFYDTDVNKPMDVRTFLDKADAAASASRMYFAYTIDEAGTVTKLDQRRTS
ncbi:hypothetical protein [Streptomyces sp. 142MFCol3.1]|uniref:hypothetical protein n=1 Tax=Streptomyces sp. 142MFCol3.1 TaxID=1172179 RepID=UPI0004037A1A|nr:hypothetical protein [Streptomyces sp. 142MFCol3.1]